MSMNTDLINGAVRLKSRAAKEGEAAVQGNRDDVPFTIELLLNATQRERESLHAIEESINTLRLSLETPQGNRSTGRDSPRSLGVIKYKEEMLEL